MNLKWYFFVESGCLKIYLEKYENIFGFFVFVEVFVENELILYVLVVLEGKSRV